MNRLVGLFIGLATCATGAFADSTPATPVKSASVQITFESIDRNADRRISRTEAGNYRKLLDRFALVDSDGDGFVSQDEFDSRPVQEIF
jgi:hypothetical protein